MPLIARKAGSGDNAKINHAPGTVETNEGSSDVFIHDHGVHRLGDNNKVHTLHQTTVSTASESVYVNDKAVARVGDSYTCGAKIETVTQGTVEDGRDPGWVSPSTGDAQGEVEILGGHAVPIEQLAAANVATVLHTQEAICPIAKEKTAADCMAILKEKCKFRSGGDLQYYLERYWAWQKDIYPSNRRFGRTRPHTSNTMNSPIVPEMHKGRFSATITSEQTDTIGYENWSQQIDNLNLDYTFNVQNPSEVSAGYGNSKYFQISADHFASPEYARDWNKTGNHQLLSLYDQDAGTITLEDGVKLDGSSTVVKDNPGNRFIYYRDNAHNQLYIDLEEWLESDDAKEIINYDELYDVISKWKPGVCYILDNMWSNCFHDWHTKHVNGTWTEYEAKQLLTTKSNDLPDTATNFGKRTNALGMVTWYDLSFGFINRENITDQASGLAGENRLNYLTWAVDKDERVRNHWKNGALDGSQRFQMDYQGNIIDPAQKVTTPPSDLRANPRGIAIINLGLKNYYAQTKPQIMKNLWDTLIHEVGGHFSNKNIVSAMHWGHYSSEWGDEVLNYSSDGGATLDRYYRLDPNSLYFQYEGSYKLLEELRMTDKPETIIPSSEVMELAEAINATGDLDWYSLDSLQQSIFGLSYYTFMLGWPDKRDSTYLRQVWEDELLTRIFTYLAMSRCLTWSRDCVPLIEQIWKFRFSPDTNKAIDDEMIRLGLTLRQGKVPKTKREQRTEEAINDQPSKKESIDVIRILDENYEVYTGPLVDNNGLDLYPDVFPEQGQNIERLLRDSIEGALTSTITADRDINSPGYGYFAMVEPVQAVIVGVPPNPHRTLYVKKKVWYKLAPLPSGYKLSYENRWSFLATPEMTAGYWYQKLNPQPK